MNDYRSDKYINFKYAEGETDIFGNMFHNCYELYFLLNGDVEFVNNRIRKSVRPYELIIIPPGEYHRFEVKGSMKEYKRCVLNIYDGFFGENILNACFFGKEIMLLSEKHRIAENFLYLIRNMSAVSKEDFIYIMSAVATDIVFLIKYSVASSDISENLRQCSINMMKYINEHFVEESDLKSLSKKLHMSVSSMCHIFKEDFGISIKKYILQKRITAAKIALQNGENAESVSSRYGFSNYSTFYRAYKKTFGISPSETAKKL